MQYTNTFYVWTYKFVKFVCVLLCFVCIGKIIIELCDLMYQIYQLKLVYGKFRLQVTKRLNYLSIIFDAY